MSNLIFRGEKKLLGLEVPNLFGGFGDNQKVMLAKTIANIHGREAKHINELINKNHARFQNDIHVIDLKNNKKSEAVLIDHGIMTQNAMNRSENIYLLSQRGYIRLLKIMDDDIAWEKWAVIEKNYFEMKEQQLPPTMSQLEILAQAAQALVEQEKAIQQLEASQMQQAEQVQGIREVVALNPAGWREDTKNLIIKMAQKLGGYGHITVLRKESYELLDVRMGVRVQTRLKNMCRRMEEEGICKSKRDKLNPLDVIADDKKLIEGYVAIIKEMAIKYGA